MKAPESSVFTDRVRAWLVGLAVALSSMSEPGAVSAMSSPLHTPSTAREASPPTWVDASASVAPVEVDPLQSAVWLRGALTEVETARRVLGALCDDTSEEAVAYLGELDDALGKAPAELSVRELPALTAQLRAARERIEAAASTWERWTRVARAVRNDPDAWLAVPERFVVREEPEEVPQPLVTFDASELRVQQMVDVFWGQRADRASG